MHMHVRSDAALVERPAGWTAGSVYLGFCLSMMICIINAMSGLQHDPLCGVAVDDAPQFKPHRQ